METLQQLHRENWKAPSYSLHVAMDGTSWLGQTNSDYRQAFSLHVRTDVPIKSLVKHLEDWRYWIAKRSDLLPLNAYTLWLFSRKGLKKIDRNGSYRSWASKLTGSYGPTLGASVDDDGCVFFEQGPGRFFGQHEMIRMKFCHLPRRDVARYIGLVTAALLDAGDLLMSMPSNVTAVVTEEGLKFQGIWDKKGKIDTRKQAVELQTAYRQRATR